MTIPLTPTQSVVFPLWTSGLTIQATIAAPSGSGVIMFPSNLSPFIASIAQSGASWSPVVTENVNRNAEIWTAPTLAGAGTVITITLSANPGFNSTQGAVFQEWAGLDTNLATLVGPTNGGTGTGATAITTNPVTPTAGRECLLLACARSGGNVTAGPSGGFTGVAIDNLRAFAAYQVVPAAAGSYVAGWTEASGSYAAVIAALYAPAATATPPIASQLINRAALHRASRW